MPDMPDWKQTVAQRLAGHALDEEAAADMAEEIEQHLQARAARATVGFARA